MSHAANTDQLLRELAAELACSGDAEEVYEVLFALLTPREREGIALRWQLVCLLEKGATQRAIAAQLGVSLCKITRGSHELKCGPKGFGKAVRRAVRRQMGGAKGAGQEG
jgi:TrpR family trp operon transcriptional repressor